AGLGHHVDAGLGVEQQPEPGAHHRLVVGDRHPDRGHTDSSGSRAWTWKPPSGAGPASSVPPYRATRSRMPISPWPEPLPAGAPGPSSRTSTCAARGPTCTRTEARPAPACLRVLVSASWTTR